MINELRELLDLHSTRKYIVFQFRYSNECAN